jgi:hypothetical protein
MKTKYRLIKLLPVLLMILLVLTLPTAVLSQPPATNLSVEATASVARTCEIHTIAIHIENVNDLTGYDLTIHFDPTVVEILDVVNDDFLDTPDDNIFYPSTNDLGNTTGVIRFGMVQQGVAVDPLVQPESGSGGLTVITLRALVPNASTDFVIHAESLLVDWPNAFAIPYTADSGTVETINCPPTADDQVVSTLMDNPVEIILTGSDPDGNPLQYTITDPPENGTISGVLPNITYTPTPGFFGEDTFAFTVFDGYDTSDPATVTVLVDQVKSAPSDILLSNNTIPEGEPVNTVIGTFTTVPEDPNASYAYTLVAGEGDDDNAAFTVEDDRLLSAQVFAYALKDTYTIRVRSTDMADNGLFAEKTFTIKVLEAPKTTFQYFFPLFYGAGD